jgi:dephospho-CoA kinase
MTADGTPLAAAGASQITASPARPVEPGRPLVIGLTGNIATGKSTVADLLAQLGAYVIDADRVAHQVMEPGQPAYRQVVEAFGQEVTSGGGPIDRATLGQIVFSDPEALARLEHIVHPAVFERIQALLAGTQAPVVVIEAIKLLEAGFSLRLCHSVWVVTADRELQIERLMRSRNLSREEAILRIEAQPPQAMKVAQADVVIENSGSLAETRAQVERAWRATIANGKRENRQG